MQPIQKSFVLGCALAIAGCAQGSPGAMSPGGLSALPDTAQGGSPLGHSHRKSTSEDPELYVFQGPPDAASPQVGLVNIGSTLYGTTYGGGANNLGALYSVTTSGVESVMHSFAGGTDGVNPDAPLTNVDGTLYGTTYQGGAAHGTIFTMTPSGSYNIVYNFGVASGDCDEPDSAMTYVPSKKALYGTAYGGGANGEGCIFKLSLAGKTPQESIVYSFTGSPSSPTSASAPVFYRKALYFTTPGGGANGYGAVFKLTLAGKLSTVYSFKGEPDGATPEAPLVVMGKALYGDTIAGGLHECGNYAGCGTVFEVTPRGKEKVLHRFSYVTSIEDGQQPQSALIAAGGTLVGTTPASTHCEGTVFSVTTSGKEKLIFDFCAHTSSPSGYPIDPYGSVVNLGGAFYGTTYEDHTSGYGTVYAVP